MSLENETDAASQSAPRASAPDAEIPSGAPDQSTLSSEQRLDVTGSLTIGGKEVTVTGSIVAPPQKFGQGSGVQLPPGLPHNVGTLDVSGHIASSLGEARVHGVLELSAGGVHITSNLFNPNPRPEGPGPGAPQWWIFPT